MEKTVLDDILPFVSKPGRYLGNEWNVVHKDWESAQVKVVLCYPDMYELGMSNLGLQILYSIINQREDSLAERVYAPGLDVEEILKERGIPLFSLESKRPLKDFDIIGFTLQHELSYTNILNILNLANISLRSRNRNGKFPLIIAGGPSASNPEPLADFIDAFVLGDGEEVIEEIIETYKNYSSSDSSKRLNRGSGLLKSLAKIPGVYVPSLYEVNYKEDGTIERTERKEAGIPESIEKRVVDLETSHYPLAPLVPLIDISQNRLNLEIQRGCPHSCRFCQSQAVYGPCRVRSRKRLLEIAEASLKSTGYDEISLTSLSSTDYPGIEGLIDEFLVCFGKNYTSVSLPSLRPDKFSLALAIRIQKIRKTGLTFAPEAGSERLRRLIGKRISDEEFASTISQAYNAGWRLVKLYFMIGLPTEEEDDIEAIIRLVKEPKTRHRNLNFNITIAPFVPKPHTPFQWLPMENLAELRRKKDYLSRRLPAQVKGHTVESSFLESVFSRGDRRLGMVLEKAWEMGCKFDQWKEHFRFDIWQEAFSKCSIDPDFYVYRERDSEEILPWSHLRILGTQCLIRPNSGDTILDSRMA
ncbi:MAG: TIGR03960 family B12-binding radical SAM protein [bacterium]